MLAFLFWFSRTTWPRIAAFRQSQIDFFANIGFEFTPLRIAVLAIGAGVSVQKIKAELSAFAGSAAAGNQTQAIGLTNS